MILSHKIKAFTLAEVLITLAIIGVVAAVTIPTLVSNYQKTQYVVQLKKVYSVMNQVLQQMAVDNGTPGSISDYFGTNSNSTIGDEFTKRIKTSLICGKTAGAKCFAVFDNNFDGSAKSNSVWTTYMNSSLMYKFISSDGMSYAVFSDQNNCTTNKGFDSEPGAPTYKSGCGFIFVDVNGAKKPNSFGRDVFILEITSNKSPLIYPVGGFYYSDSNSGSSAAGGSDWWNYNNANHCSSVDKSGWRCSARIIEKSWTMDY